LLPSLLKTTERIDHWWTLEAAAHGL
jgi:hypothetical protein